MEKTLTECALDQRWDCWTNQVTFLGNDSVSFWK